MASAPEWTAPRQLMLDVDRPILMRPRRDRGVRSRGGASDLSAGQMEFPMQPVAEPVLHPMIKEACSVITDEEVETGPYTPEPELRRPEPAAFSAWLLDQSKRAGTLGDLAKAVRLDRRFPKSGSADDVRRHFGSIGAEGDAFEALDDAERAYHRL